MQIIGQTQWVGTIDADQVLYDDSRNPLQAPVLALAAETGVDRRSGRRYALRENRIDTGE